ncbi:MAG: hypothetical protein QG592_370 [Pseudomonadota bacterium]|nr:hypothetical protein [Pseudomonadota bacterium]
MKKIGCIGHDGDCCKNRERDKRDAARYRWWRKHASDDMQWYLFGRTISTPKEMDAETDKAMKRPNAEITGSKAVRVD